MTEMGFAGLLFGVCLLLIALRMPVAVAMFAVGGVGFASLAGWPAFLNLINTTPFSRASGYTLSVLPLFLLMGQFASRAGLSRSLFDSARAWVGHRRGGLAISSVYGCAVFGSICGSSFATAATMASVALPEMKRHGYSGALATGALAAGGTLGILIPPSVILVIYAVITEQSIGRLFLAALIPGVISTLGYAVAISAYVRIFPRRAPSFRPCRSPSGCAAWARCCRSQRSSWWSSAASISACSPRPKAPRSGRRPPLCWRLRLGG